MSNEIEERKIGGLTVKIDRTACAAYQACIAEAPSLFRLGDDNVVTFTDAPEAAARDRVIEACRACPVDALAVFDEDGAPLAP